jgi:hypothetical protein
MPRAPLVLSAIGIFCASSYFALADERGAIANAAARDGSTIVQRSAAKHRHDVRGYRRDRGYDESSSVTIISAHGA